MSGHEVTYHQQMSFCGKPQCHKCRDGKGHGPYWYAYRTVDGKTTRTYVGKHLPADVHASLQASARVQQHPLLPSPGEQSASIRIYTLGQFRLERRDGTDWQIVTDPAWQQQRVRAVLGYLISNEKRMLGREQLLDALWPDVDKETASHRLDRAVYTLRQLFEPVREKLATSPLLLTERDFLMLADQFHLWVDADAFDALLAQARVSAVPNETERLLEEAAMLYGGDLLPEERSNEWVITRRGQLQRSWIGLLLELADLRIGRDALPLAIEPLDRLLAHDPTSEAAVQRLMRIFARLGRRGEALRAYKRLAAALYEEYKIAPLPETRALYDAVRRGSNDSMKRQHEDGTSAASSQSAPLPRDHAPSLQIGRTHQSPLVGREQELALLRDLLLRTENTAKFTLSSQKKGTAAPFDAQRRPQSVLLLGEVGIGKTRLAEELGRKARQRGWAVAWSRVYAQEGSIPYRLWIDVLRKALAHHGGIGLSSTRAGQSQGAPLPATFPPQFLQRSLVYQPLATLLPELRSILPEGVFPPSPAPEQEQLRLWEAVRELLVAISESTPLLIVLDDLQWADGGSYELLGYLARRLSDQPIVILGTCRHNELSANSPLRPLLTDLQREHATEVLHLAPLGDEEIRLIVSELLSRTQQAAAQSIAEPTVQRIQTRAAGNPFFAEELARSIIATDPPDLVGVSPALQRAPDGPPALPETITAVLDLRLSRLSPACQRLLSRAAVLGGSFEFPIIAAMESGPSGGNEDVVLDLLEEGLRSGMLSEEGIGSRVTYSFWHPLLVNHLYEGLSAGRRASLHRRAAEILLRVYAPDEAEGAAIITHHLVRGGAHSDQITYFAELAADRAYSLSAYPDAERHYRTVLEHMSQHADELQHRAYILELLGECTRIQGKYEEARRFYEQALEVRGQRSAGTSQAEHQQEAQIDALLWCEIGSTWYQMGDNVQARQCYEHGEHVLEEAGIASGPAWARLYYWQGHTCWSEGNYNEARSKAQESLRSFEEMIAQQHSSLEYVSRLTGIRRILAGDPVNLGRVYSLLGTIEALGGRSGNAITHFNTALTLFEQYDCQREIAIACCNAGDAYMRKSEYPQAQAILRRSLSIAERIGDIPVSAYVFGNLGMLDTRLGNLTEAEDEFRRSITLVERIDDPISVSFFHSDLATVLQEQGKLLEAKATLGHAFVVGRTIHIAPCLGVALVAIGSLRIAQAMAMDLDGEGTVSLKEKIHTLKQAKKSLRHALVLAGLETETRIEGQLVQARVSLLLGEIESALQQTRQTLEEASLSELTWIVAGAQRVLGSIFAAQGKQEQAEKYFEQALRTFRKCGMRLECGRTLQQYGDLLMQQDGKEGKRYAQGLEYLRDAHQLFTECKAMLDLRGIERVLAEYEQVKAQ